MNKLPWKRIIKWELAQDIIVDCLEKYWFPSKYLIGFPISGFYCLKLNNKEMGIEELISRYLESIVQKTYFSFDDLKSISEWETYLKVDEDVKTFFDFFKNADIKIKIRIDSILNNNLVVKFGGKIPGDKKLVLQSLRDLNIYIPGLEIQEIFSGEVTFDDEIVKKRNIEMGKR